MTSFETKIPSIVEVEEKTSSSNLKRVVINKAHKQAKQAKTFHNLSTSKTMLSLDIARLEVNKIRR